MILKTHKAASLLLIVFMSAALFAVSGCRQGKISKKPPIHINPNMDSTPRYNPQSYSPFFQDHTTMRPLVEGTVARGWLREDVAYFQGKDKRGNWVKNSPVPATMESLERGRERYDIYCAACHSRVGDGKGMVVKKGFMPPPDFHTDKIRNYPDGQIYDVITNGIRNMPSYAMQVPVDDRWHIINYVRALQRSQFARLDDVPEEKQDALKQR